MSEDYVPCPTCASCPDCLGTGKLPPLKVCANERCGKEFRFKEGGKKASGVRFCSTRCENAQGQRELRRRRKQSQE